MTAVPSPSPGTRGSAPAALPGDARAHECRLVDNVGPAYDCACGERIIGASGVERHRLYMEVKALRPVLEAAEAALDLVTWDRTRPHAPMGSVGVCRLDGDAWPCRIERLRAAVEQARGGPS